jgi:hypothetical protein
MEDMLRQMMRLAMMGDSSAVEGIKEHLLRVTIPIAERDIPVLGYRSMAQDDLNDLNNEVIQLIMETHKISEYYPDKIAIVSMTTKFNRQPGKSATQEVIDVIDFVVTRIRERYPSPYQPLYLVRCIFDRKGHCRAFLYVDQA